MSEELERRVAELEGAIQVLMQMIREQGAFVREILAEERDARLSADDSLRSHAARLQGLVLGLAKHVGLNADSGPFLELIEGGRDDDEAGETD